MENIFNYRILILSILVVFLIRQFVTWRDIRILRYLITPLVTTMILIVVFQALLINSDNFYIRMIFWGLVMSLIADTVLMIKEIDTLPYGLLYFLTAHILYSIAFFTHYIFVLWQISIIIILMPVMIILFIKMYKKAGSLAPAVLIYMLAISVMVYAGISGLGSELSSSRILAAAGAVLFLISDIILGINAFITPIKHSSVVVWSLYAPGQLLIALSCF